MLFGQRDVGGLFLGERVNFLELGHRQEREVLFQNAGYIMFMALSRFYTCACLRLPDPQKGAFIRVRGGGEALKIGVEGWVRDIGQPLARFVVRELKDRAPSATLASAMVGPML